VSKPSASKLLFPAVWAGAIAFALILFLTLASDHSRQANQAAPVRISGTPAPGAEQRNRIHTALDALPLAFERNQGQMDSRVRYRARGKGYTAFLTAQTARFLVSPSAPSPRTLGMQHAPQSRAQATEAVAIDMHPVGGNPAPEIVAANPVPGTINYFIGSDRSQWLLGVQRYAAVTYRDVYPGVNLAFHGAEGQLEFDFIVAPGASPAVIDMGFEGARKLATDASGNLVLSSHAGDVLLHKPVAYQENSGRRELVDVAFEVRSRNEVRFALGRYDPTRALVIDPSLSYATYVGGNDEDEAYAIAVDGSGAVYVTGQTDSTSFNGQAGGPDTLNVFVAKLNPTGTAYVYTDVFEAATSASTNCSSASKATGSCSGNAIAVDSNGDAYVAGTATGGFPVTSGSFQATFGGGTTDGFILKLNAAGSLVYSTYLGGSGADVINAIAVDSNDNAYIAGQTNSTDFPTASPIQSANNGTTDAFVTKLNPGGTAIVYSTYLGGSMDDLATGIALDGNDNAYVTGITVSLDFPTTGGVFQPKPGGNGDDDGFVTEVNAAGSAWTYSTYLGGSGADDALAIAVDPTGEAYVTGSTNSTNFPTVNPAQSALGGSSATNIFVSKLSPNATGLEFSTYYGGNQTDFATGIALDAFEDVYVTGQTTSPNYPTAGAPFQTALNGPSDAFVTEFSNTGFIEYSSFLGGSGAENFANLSSGISSGEAGAIAVDGNGNAYLAGSTTSSTDFPVSAGVAQSGFGGAPSDGFVAKVGPGPTDFSVALSPSSIATSSGATTSPITVRVSSVNSAYGQAVTLTCSGLPSGAACDFSTPSLTPGSTPETTSLTISTNGSAKSNRVSAAANRHLTAIYGLLLPLLGIAVLGAGSNPRSRKGCSLLVVGVLLMTLVILPACGSSGRSGSGNQGNGSSCVSAPNSPSALSASGTSSAGTTLSWTPSTAGANCTVTGYTIYQNGTAIGTSTTPSFNVTGLAALTTYSFAATATDSAGASAQSSPLSVTTNQTGTQAGTYSITVTATGTNNVSHSVPLTLTVN
jgi:hypothetical protein